jgi:hypothetical protein
MRHPNLTASALGTLLALCLFAMPAHAQATRTWVSGVGDDANPCSRTSPCKTFAGAISKTAVGGEINCLDPGGFGALTITKSIIISCETGTAGVLVSGTNGIVVQVGANDNVYLRGLDFEGLTTGLSGILFNAAGTLHVEKSLIRGFSGSAGGAGILFAPTGPAALYVADTVVSDNGGNAGSTTGGGILILPGAGGSGYAVLNRVQVTHNNFGLTADGGGTTGGISVSIDDSIVSENLHDGISAKSTSGGIRAMINRTDTSNNGGVGIHADGAPAEVFIGGSVVTGNSTGVSILNGATVQSYQNNQINGNNVTDGTPVPAVALH